MITFNDNLYIQARFGHHLDNPTSIILTTEDILYLFEHKYTPVLKVLINSIIHHKIKYIGDSNTLYITAIIIGDIDGIIYLPHAIKGHCAYHVVINTLLINEHYNEALQLLEYKDLALDTNKFTIYECLRVNNEYTKKILKLINYNGEHIAQTLLDDLLFNKQYESALELVGHTAYKHNMFDISKFTGYSLYECIRVNNEYTDKILQIYDQRDILSIIIELESPEIPMLLNKYKREQYLYKYNVYPGLQALLLRC